MVWDLDDTIVAESSAPGRAERAIIRLSGGKAVECLSRAFELEYKTEALRTPSIISTRAYLPALQRSLDVQLVIWPGTRSYTRQPMAEVHLIGSPPVVHGMLELLCESGARLARPGEFTLRAYLAGRIDLSQAEAVLSVIDANSQDEIDQALNQLAGGVGSELQATQESLLNLIADVEAGLDFVEEDIEFVSGNEIRGVLSEASQVVQQILAKLAERRVEKSDFKVVLFGCPNVGKSSLFNRLVGSELANVDADMGTTRDFLATDLALDESYRVRLVDTAGVRELADLRLNSGADIVEIYSEQRSLAQINNADFKILVLNQNRVTNEWERTQLEKLDLQSSLIVHNKADLPREVESNLPHMQISCKTGEGLARLKDEIARAVDRVRVRHNRSILAHECVNSVVAANSAIAEALQLVSESTGTELVAERIREAIDCLGVVTGTIHTEDILDKIFGRFCIGK